MSQLGKDAFTDLAATDILRTREFGVPRYNEFRRRLNLPPKPTFRDLTGDGDLARRISAVYDGDIEKVDLVVGLMAEQRPAGFAISDTAFRIFLRVASRRPRRRTPVRLVEDLRVHHEPPLCRPGALVVIAARRPGRGPLGAALPRRAGTSCSVVSCVRCAYLCRSSLWVAGGNGRRGTGPAVVANPRRSDGIGCSQ